MRAVAAPALVLGAAVLAGCATPGPPPRGGDAIAAAAGIEVPRQWSPGGPALSAAMPEATAGWLAQLGDPALLPLVAEAMAANQDLRAAAARVAAARARSRLAGAAERPRMDAGLDAARRGAPAGQGRRLTANSFDVGLDAAWELDLWGRLARTTRAAELDADASAADLAAARLSLAASVARGWFDALESSLQLALAEETASNFAANLEVVEEGFRHGLNSALDVRLERANLAAAEARVHARRVTRDGAVRALEILLGRYPGAELTAAGELPALEVPVPAGLPAAVLARRPDVRAAALRLGARDERLAVALANRLPGLQLTGRGGLTSATLGNLLDLDALVWTLAAGLAAPLVRGGELAAERALARADVSEALAGYAQTVLVAFREVEAALSAERYLADQEAALRVAASEAREAEMLALERYRSGLVDIVTWLEARRRAFDARSSLIAVSNERLQTRVRLHLALGGDFAAPAPAATPLVDGSDRR